LAQGALIASANSPGYPLTTGNPELREALKQFASHRLGVRGDFDVLPTIGSKELVALLPFLLQAKRILIPEIAYPTYRVGGILAGAEVIEVGINPKDWRDDVDLVWINSPSNPTGRVHSESELRSVIDWSREKKIPIASDECYLPFPDSKKGVSILALADGDNSGLLAVHSLSKRSNMAGYRGAFVVGDSVLIKRLLEIRKHIGMMSPQPIQRAMAVALADEEHVEKQADRYRRRRAVLRSALESTGFSIEESHAGLYLWCTRGEEDWTTVGWFADRGIIVTPGRFYGDRGSRHVRIALTATDAQIADAATRIRS
jgi:succinyldiaminopimelate transaminase